MCAQSLHWKLQSSLSAFLLLRWMLFGGQEMSLRICDNGTNVTYSPQWYRTLSRRFQRYAAWSTSTGDCRTTWWESEWTARNIWPKDVQESICKITSWNHGGNGSKLKCIRTRIQSFRNRKKFSFSDPIVFVFIRMNQATLLSGLWFYWR